MFLQGNLLDTYMKTLQFIYRENMINIQNSAAQKRNLLEENRAKSGKAVNKLICIKCGKEKDVSEFQKRPDSKTGYYRQCKECQKETRKLRREKNKLNPNKYLKSRIDSLNKASGRRTGKSKEIIENSSPISLEEIQTLIKEKGLKCSYCNIPLTYESMVFDHIIPLCKDGEHSIHNVQLCCKDCNNLKLDRTDKEFRIFLQNYIKRFANPEVSSKIAKGLELPQSVEGE